MRTRYLFAAAILAATLVASGCAIPREAIVQRTELATRAAMNAEQAAGEVDQMAAKLVAVEAERVRLAKQLEYERAMARVTTPEQGAVLGYNYAQDLAEIQGNAAAEARRLGQIGSKVRVSGAAAQALNRMADKEAAAAKQWEDIAWEEALPAAIAIVEQVQTHELKKQADEEARLAAEAEAARRDAEREAEEEHGEGEHEEPAPQPTPTPAPTPTPDATPAGS